MLIALKVLEFVSHESYFWRYVSIGFQRTYFLYKILYYLSIYQQEINLLLHQMLINFAEGGKSVEHKLRRESDEDLQNGKWKIMTYGETEVTVGKV